MRDTTINDELSNHQTRDKAGCQTGGQPFASLHLWPQALARMYGPRPPERRQGPSFPFPLEDLGRLVGVRRQEFESDWAFARYLQIRLGYFIKDELARHVDRLFIAMQDSRAPSANGSDAAALYAEAF